MQPFDLALATERVVQAVADDAVYSLHAGCGQGFRELIGHSLCHVTEGVLLGEKEPQWLKAGDEVSVEIDGLGRLTNRFIAR